MKNRDTKEVCALQERLLTHGSEAMSDTELLGLVMDSPSLARTLVMTSDDWQDLGRAELGIIPRFRTMHVAQVLALVELSKRIGSKKLKRGEQICCSSDVTAVYRPKLACEKQEVFVALALDSKNRVMAEHFVARGTLTQAEVHPREVFRKLIRDGAARTVGVHNHPSGDPRPSPEDVALCRRLFEAGELVGISLVDFIVVAADGSASLRDLGLMGGA